MTEKNIFEDIEEVNVTQTAVPADTDDGSDDPTDDGASYKALSADAFDDTAPVDRAKKIKLNGQVVQIIDVAVTAPKTVDRKTGLAILPNISQKNATVAYYKGKLKLTFQVGDEKIVEYYSNIKYFIDTKTKQIQKVPRLQREGKNTVVHIFQLYAAHMKKKPEEISDKAFLEGLKNLKVKIKTEEGVWNGNAYFRNDIESFI